MHRLSTLACSVLALCMTPALAVAQVSIQQVQQGAPQTNQGARNTDAFDEILATLQARSGASAFAAPAGSFGPAVTPSATGATPTNQAILNQIGQGNTGAITQSGLSNAATAIVIGNGNATTQTQTGNGNTSLLGINGNNNNAAITSSGQNGSPGDSNVSAYSIIGNNNSLSSSQTGSNLTYGLSIIGSGKNITITQDGAGAQANRGVPTLSPGVAAGIATTTSR